MLVDKKFDDLIRADWNVLKSDFNTDALQNWKKQASSGSPIW